MLLLGGGPGLWRLVDIEECKGSWGMIVEHPAASEKEKEGKLALVVLLLCCC